MSIEARDGVVTFRSIARGDDEVQSLMFGMRREKLVNEAAAYSISETPIFKISILQRQIKDLLLRDTDALAPVTKMYFR